MKGTCTFQDCGRSEHARGLCEKHYRRQLRHGSPAAVKPRGRKREPMQWKEELRRSGGSYFDR